MYSNFVLSHMHALVDTCRPCIDMCTGMTCTMPVTGLRTVAGSGCVRTEIWNKAEQGVLAFLGKCAETDYRVPMENFMGTFKKELSVADPPEKHARHEHLIGDGMRMC
jgi:hypothetical protein